MLSCCTGFYCYEDLQKIYLGVSTLILIIGILIAWVGAGESPKASMIRNCGFASLVAFGIVPAARKLLRIIYTKSLA